MAEAIGLGIIITATLAWISWTGRVSLAYLMGLLVVSLLAWAILIGVTGALQGNSGSSEECFSRACANLYR